jgi:hypothetical protein
MFDRLGDEGRTSDQARSVAIAHGINAKVFHRWQKLARKGSIAI